MNREIIRGALTRILEGDVFVRIKDDINDFFRRYGVIEWLSLSQAATIHEILMLGEKDLIKERLDKYTGLHLKRASEKDKWQKEIDSKKAIDYFFEMVSGLLDRHLSFISEALDEKFRLVIDDSYHTMIYQSLINTFDYIFITELRTKKEVL